MPSKIARVTQMSAPEVSWRLQSAARVALQRVNARVRTPRWNRADVLDALIDDARLQPLRLALQRQDWTVAHAAFCHCFVHEPDTFVISPTSRVARADRIQLEFPHAVDEARRRADRLMSGDFDLLGYQNLRFASSRVPAPPNGSPSIDWLLDPVSGRRMTRGFWSTLDYLDPKGADHKVVWELNRHQHWLPLARAYCLTGDRRYRDAVVAQLVSWIHANPPLMTGNWVSMLELAFRMLSWIWTLNMLIDEVPDSEPPWTIDLLMAFDRQMEHVEQNLSYYFSPNTHLVGEALALYVVGRTLTLFRRSERWQQVGRRVLLDEIGRQIARDGGHRERSTHYHRYTLDFYLLALAVARVTGDSAEAALRDAVRQLATAARVLADDRGRLPHIGDDDGGVLFPMCRLAPDDIRDSLAIASVLLGRPDLRIDDAPEEAFWWLDDPHGTSAPADTERSARSNDDCFEPLSTALPETGYYVSRTRAGDHLLIDAGPHGYRNCGHAHADALSLTYTVRGTPLLIDPGTGSYTADPEMRDRFRSAAFHNTVVIDGRSQSIPAGPFHWTCVARATAREWQTGEGFDYFEGSHDGYLPIEHRRHVFVIHGDLLIVLDLVAGKGRHTANVYWHVSPVWRVETDGRRALISHPTNEAAPRSNVIELMTAGSDVTPFHADVVSGLGWWSPAYGRVEPASTLRITRRDVAPFWVATVFGLDMENPIAGVELVPVQTDAGIAINSTGLRVSRLSSIDRFMVAESVSPDTGSLRRRFADLETTSRILFARTSTRSTTRIELIEGAFVRSEAPVERHEVS